MSDERNDSPSAQEVVWREFEQSSKDLQQVRSIVAGAAAQLGGGFMEVVRESKAQQQLLMSLLAQVDSHSAQRGSIAAFVTGSEELVGQVTENLEEASRRTLGLVEQLKSIDVAFKDLTHFTKSILEVSDEIRILALNANLAATRAGEAGRGFAVVATAVRDLSNSYRALTDEIRGTVDAARQSLTASMQGALAAAAEDRVTVRNARADMQRLEHSTQAIRQEMEETLQQATRMGESIQRGVSSCLVGFQFDDLVGQICDAAQKRMVACQALRHASSCDPIGGASSLEALAALQALQHRSVQQTSLDVGDVEFF